eukprot:11082721-Alexandrium_andersonii.AAC.1
MPDVVGHTRDGEGSSPAPWRPPRASQTATAPLAHAAQMPMASRRPCWSELGESGARGSRGQARPPLSP